MCAHLCGLLFARNGIGVKICARCKVLFYVSQRWSQNMLWFENHIEMQSMGGFLTKYACTFLTFLVIFHHLDIYGNKLVNTIETKPLCASSSDLSNQFLCRLRSIAAHRDHFVRRLSVCACVCLSDSHTFLIVTHSYVSQATHAFLGMLPLCLCCHVAF